MRIEPLEAERRRRMSARAEGEPGIHPHDRGLRLRDLLVMRADPQPPAESHRVEVAQPFALPGPVGHLARVQESRIEGERAAQGANDRVAIDVGRKEGLDACGRPEPKLSGRGLEDGRGVPIVRIDEGDGDRSAGETGRLRVLRRKPPEIPADLVECA